MLHAESAEEVEVFRRAAVEKINLLAAERIQEIERED